MNAGERADGLLAELCYADWRAGQREAVVAALEAGDLAAVGEAFRAGHASLRDLFEVSSPELDALVEIATMPELEARNRIVIRTRRYAAYQRKWMRRIPDLVSVDGTLSSEEVADAILEMARARQ